MLGLGACSDTNSNHTPLDNSESQNNALYTQVLGQARKIALLQQGDGKAKLAVLDADEFVQINSPFELWMYLAIVADKSGRRYALQQRMVRMQVKAKNESSHSDWDFSQVLAVDYSLDHLGNEVNQSQSIVQRVALELAGADPEKQRVWVDTYETTATRIGQCEQSYLIKNSQLTLRFVQRRCAQVQSTNSFSYLRSAVMPVNGDFKVNGDVVSVEGHGWMIHGWGVPPDTNATAVVFDRAWLLLDNAIDVQLQRSRRRSGRGPKITTGSVRFGHADAIQLAGATFEDLDLNIDTNSSKNWRFKAPINKIDISITSASKKEVSESMSQLPRFDAVLVEGSHTGFGFVNLSAL